MTTRHPKSNLPSANMVTLQNKKRAPRNRTVSISDEERERFSKKLVRISAKATATQLLAKTVNQDVLSVLDHLPADFVDLLFIDPPYNLTKDFGATSFKEMTSSEYASWFHSCSN